jgi:hypothetical protein
LGKCTSPRAVSRGGDADHDTNSAVNTGPEDTGPEDTGLVVSPIHTRFWSKKVRNIVSAGKLVN